MNSQKQHLLANRSRRIPRRIRQIQSELKSHDQRCSRIEEDLSVSKETRAAQIKRIRDLCGPLNYQLRVLSERANELPVQMCQRGEPNSWQEWNGIPRLTESGNFPESTTGRRVGKCTRAFRTVTAAYRSLRLP